METIPHMCCVGCGAAACIWNCLRSHNNRYHCHNPRCMFYSAGSPDAASQAPDQTAAPPAGGDTATVAQRRETVPPTDPNVIGREWPLVGGEAALVTTEQTSTAASPTPASTAPASSPNVPALPAPADTSPPPAADAPRSSTPPVTFTFEEFETLVELLSRFSQRRGRRPQRRRRRARAGRRVRGAMGEQRRRVFIRLE